MKSLKIKNMLEGAEKITMNENDRNENIREIKEALEEKRIRETQNLDIRLKKDELCAEMKKLDEINNILNSTSKNGIGCPINGEIQQEQYEHLTCKGVESCIVEKKVVVESPKTEQHPIGCHCEKCCPNPKKTWFQRNKQKLAVGIMWIIMFILALGISPQGAWFTTLQESFVNILVDLFKMGLFVVAGVLTFRVIIPKDKEDD